MIYFKFKLKLEFLDLSSNYLYKTVTLLEEFMSNEIDVMHIDNEKRETLMLQHGRPSRIHGRF